jgi:copper chaperone CopZ
MNSTITLKQPASPKQKISNKSTIEETFPVTGMTCASCAVRVESTLKSISGVQEATVNFADQSSRVSYDPKVTTPEIFKNNIQSIGYDLVIDLENKNSLKEEAQEKHRKLYNNGYESCNIHTFYRSIFVRQIKEKHRNANI